MQFHHLRKVVGGFDFWVQQNSEASLGTVDGSEIPNVSNTVNDGIVTISTGAGFSSINNRIG